MTGGVIRGIVNRPNPPFDLIEAHALLAERRTAPCISGNRPAIRPDSFPSQVGEIVHIARASHEEASVAESAHREDRQANERAIAHRPSNEKLTKRMLDRMNRWISARRDEGRFAVEIDNHILDDYIAAREGCEMIVVVDHERDRWGVHVSSFLSAPDI